MVMLKAAAHISLAKRFVASTYLMSLARSGPTKVSFVTLATQFRKNSKISTRCQSSPLVGRLSLKLASITGPMVLRIIPSRFLLTSVRITFADQSARSGAAVK